MPAGLPFESHFNAAGEIERTRPAERATDVPEKTRAPS
jgi:hypothetical protein